jgi:hypothetical protein
MAYGEKISPILEEIEDTLWEFESNYPTIPHKFTTMGFRAAIKIFMACLMDKMWIKQEKEKVDFKIRLDLAEQAGKDIRALVKKYTDIDSHDLYKVKKKNTKL